MGEGIDVGAERVSSLGKEVVRFALSGAAPSRLYVEVGAGKGRLAAVMSLLGFRCHLYDHDPSLVPHYRRLKGCFGMEGLEFHLKDVRDLRYRDVPEGIGVVVAERVLHHLKFREAVRVLKLLKNRILPGGRFFLSFSGLNSPIGEGYPYAHLPVEERYGRLRGDVAERFRITGEVCLYAVGDVRRLMEEVGGMREITVRETAFGNVLAIYEKAPQR